MSFDVNSCARIIITQNRV